MSPKFKGVVARKNASAPEAISASAAVTPEKRPRLVSIGGATTSPAPATPLSSRALNVLKLLAPELTGETPPKGKWTPTNALLQKLTMKRLSTARNCGPQTADEIIQ